VIHMTNEHNDKQKKTAGKTQMAETFSVLTENIPYSFPVNTTIGYCSTQNT